MTLAGIDIDRRKPTVRVQDGRAYDKARKVRCKATDKHSGVRVCNVHTKRRTQRDGDAVVRYRVKATDNAGNTKVVRGRYLIDR